MNIGDMAANSHRNALNKGFWLAEPLIVKYDMSPEDAETLRAMEVGTKIALIHSELSEALEGYRKGDMENFAEEMADVEIRNGDLAGGTGVDLEKEVTNKMEKNLGRGFRHGGKKF